MTQEIEWKVGFEKWEADEFVITLNGYPVGYTMGRLDFDILEWFNVAGQDIASIISRELGATDEVFVKTERR
jgi:hypothetical protein